jgi:carboxymethylenebutenolidase
VYKWFFATIIVVALVSSSLSSVDSEKIVLKTGPNIYRIGHLVALFLFEPDLNRDSDKAESYSLDLIEFRSDKVRVTLGDHKDEFDANPSALRETGDNTGVFYTVIKIPREIDGKKINFGEKVSFEYSDSTSVASVFVGENIVDYTLDGYISNAEAQIILDKQDSLEIDESSTESHIHFVTMADSPRAQFLNNISIQSIKCAEGLELIMKKSNGMPACVRPSSISILIERGWGVHVLPDYEKSEDNNSEYFTVGDLAVRTENVVYFENYEGYLAQPEIDGDYPGIILIHEWWGLNDNMKQMAENLASHGYVALAVDLYGVPPAITADEARQLISSYQSEKGIENMDGAVNYLIENQHVLSIGSIGWCFGGGESLNLALNNDMMDATVIYYGRLTSDTASLSSISWPVLGIFGGLDQGIPVDSVRQFEATLNELGIPNEVYIYENANHAFANPSGDRYSPEDAKDAWQKTLAFFEKHLKSI